MRDEHRIVKNALKAYRSISSGHRRGGMQRHYDLAGQALEAWDYLQGAMSSLMAACEQASLLLDALRLENDVASILAPGEKSNYRYVDEQIKTAISEAKDKVEVTPSLQGGTL